MQSSPVICLYQLYNLDLLETVVRAVFAVPAGIPELAFIWLAWATDPKKHKVGLDGCGCCLYGYNTSAAITLVTRLKLTQELCVLQPQLNGSVGLLQPTVRSVKKRCPVLHVPVHRESSSSSFGA